MRDSKTSKLWEISASACEEVEAIRSDFKEHCTVWHFLPFTNEDEDDLNLSSSYWSKIRFEANRRFPTAITDVIGFHCGVEILEEVAPTLRWLRARMHQMVEFGDAVGLSLQGWSYEPKGFPGGVPPQASICEESD